MMPFLENSTTEYGSKLVSIQKPKGFIIPFGYKGFINGKYQLFATEDEYKEILKNDT